MTDPQSAGAQGPPSREEIQQLVDQRIAQVLGLKPDDLKSYDMQGGTFGTPTTIPCGSITTVVIHC